MLGNDRATLVVAVVIGAVATGLDIAGYSLDNGVTNVDVTARFVGVVVSGGDCGRELAFCERIHDRAVLDDDVVLVGEEGAGFIVPCTCTDRYGCAIERDALVDIDAIPNATCVEGSVRDREAVFTVDGGVFLGACLDLAATRDLDVAVGPNRIVFDRACLYLAAALYDEVLVSIDTLILGGLGGDGSAVVDRDVAVGPDAIRIARGVNVSRALDGDIAPGIDGIVLGARGVDSASAVDVDAADGSDGVTRRCHVERAGRVALNIKLGVLVRAILNLDAAAVAVSDDVVALVAHVELARCLDRAAVIAVELHIVGAVPGPGAGLVACCSVVLSAADVDPLGRERDARHEQRAHRKRAYGAYNDAARHAAPAAVCEQRATAHVGLDKMGSRGFVIALGGREQGGHGYSHPHRAYAIKPSISAGCSRR